MILVTGATGTVGREVVAHLVAAGQPVRAATRRTATAQLPDSVDVVYADLGDPASLPAVMDDVDRVFLISAGPQIPLHDSNVVRAAGGAHIVKLSSGRAGDPAATDPIPTWHRAGEQAVRDSGLPWTFLRPMGFMANALMWASSIRDHDTVYAPYAGGRIATIDPYDVAAVATTVLTSPGHENQTYTLSGPEALSPAEQVAILANVLARPLKYVEVTPEIARQSIVDHGVPANIADAIMALRATALDEFTSIIHPSVEKLTGTPATSFRDWAVRNVESFR
jgi:uncharacterized protein YbjT (DUF2867 family)